LLQTNINVHSDRDIFATRPDLKSTAVTSENSPLDASTDSVRSGTCQKKYRPARGRNEMIMHHNKDNIANREMNNSSTAALHEIHFAGMHEGCISKPIENPLHPKAQQREQMILHGYYRSRIPDFGPLRGEAG
jgi:hypothetical protein